MSPPVKTPEETSGKITKRRFSGIIDQVDAEEVVPWGGALWVRLGVEGIGGSCKLEP